MKGGEEEREKAKGRKRRSEHRDRSVILLDSARSPVTFECSVDFTLAKGEHRRKKKKTRTSIPSWLPSLFVLPPFSSQAVPLPLPFLHFFPRNVHLFAFPPPIFLRSSTIQETPLRSISSVAIEKETEKKEGEEERGKKRERETDR